MVNLKSGTSRSLAVRHKQKKKMKKVKIILLLIAFLQISYGQNETNGFEKEIITIEYFGSNSDTTFQIIPYDVNGNRIEAKSQYISNPIKTDTTYISGSEMIMEDIWEDNSRTIRKEINSPRNLTKIGIDRNGIDTIYFSEFKLGMNGLPLEGIVVNHGDTTKYEINQNLSIEEMNEIHAILLRDSEFIDFRGIIQIPNTRKIIITEPEEPRNTVEIRLNKKLQPKSVIKRQWHEYHKTIFVNRYSYKYQNDKVVEIKNVDMYGDLEMTRTIDYK